jgi:tetratricopeptide (TPR) repeat protein
MKFLISILMVGHFLFSQDADIKNAMKSLKVELEQAHYLGSIQSVEALRAKAERLLNLDKNNWHLNYYMAFTYDLLGSILMVSDEDKADDYFDIALEYLEISIERQPSADAYALKSSVYGKKIGISPMKGMFLGPKSNSAIDAAYGVSKDNPRVWIIEAIGKMYTPEFFGGDRVRSRELLLKAGKELETYEEQDSLMIVWGKFDVLAWLSELSILEEKYAEAKTYAEKALALEPKYGFVIYRLMPRIEAGLKNK